MPVFGQIRHDCPGEFLSVTVRIDRFGSGTDVVPESVSGENVSGYRAGHLNDSATILNKCHNKTSKKGLTDGGHRRLDYAMNREDSAVPPLSLCAAYEVFRSRSSKMFKN